jgi:hypothetical protein
MTESGLGIPDWNDLDDIRDNLGGHCTLIINCNCIPVGYDKLAVQTANREKPGADWQL